MILIADSGATKTDWRLEDNDKKIHQFRSKGFSPYMQTSNEIALLIKEEIASQINTSEVRNVFYYGTGCTSDENKSTFRKAFISNFRSEEHTSELQSLR